MTSEHELWVITEDTPIVNAGAERDDPVRGFTPNEEGVRLPTAGKKRVPLDALALKAQMEGLIHVVGDLFSTAEIQTGMQLDSVQLSVAISADGKVNLIGMGGGLANSGGITLTFTREADSPRQEV
jgi:hypothetical protein